MSTRNLPAGKKRPTTLPPSMSRMSENVVASTSRNPKGLRGLYRDNFTLPFTLLAYIFISFASLFIPLSFVSLRVFVLVPSLFLALNFVIGFWSAE
jgi:hypothetical protein